MNSQCIFTKLGTQLKKTCTSIKGMSHNLRKRPSILLDDNINNKKRQRTDDTPKVVTPKVVTTESDPLKELRVRNGELEELPVEEVISEDSLSSDEEYIDFDEELENLKETDPELHNALQVVQAELEKTEPDVKVLLRTPLRIEDRAKLCQFYEIYKSSQPNTMDWLDARNRYNAMFKEYKVGYKQHIKFTDKEHERMAIEESSLTNYNPQLTLKYKILNLQTSRANKVAIYRRYEDLQNLEGSCEEYNKLKHWLEWATSIPHDNIKEVKVVSSRKESSSPPSAKRQKIQKHSDITRFIMEASRKLDEELFGMRKAKEQILLFLSAKLTNPGMKRSNLGLVGPPGVGKTAIARMIAKLMDWGFEQISFGGVDKADFLKGHEYTYVGAQPGAIVKCLRRMGHKNGVIFLDELEKAAVHPDIRAALLHLVDQSQNHEFRDNFLGDITIDLSHIWYVGSMNSVPTDSALADRWWTIEIKGYSKKDKIEIIQGYLLPKALKSICKSNDSISMSRDTCDYFIRRVSKQGDMGVRTIQKAIGDIINKIDFLVTHQDVNGNIPFTTTFKMKKKLSYPLEITKSIIDKLVANKELDTMLRMMYL